MIAATTPTGSRTSVELPTSSSHVELHRALRVVGEGHGRQTHLDALGEHERHAHFVGDGERDLVAALGELLRDAREELAALLGAGVGPAGEGRGGRLDGLVGLLDGSRGNGGVELAGARLVTSRVSPEVAFTHSPLM